jgi:putative two-component system response regulator
VARRREAKDILADIDDLPRFEPRRKAVNIRERWHDRAQELAALAEYSIYPCAKHHFRVGRLSELLARHVGEPQTVSNDIAFAGTLHDIGKVVLSRELLGKKLPLNGIETESMRRHTTMGAELLEDFDGEEFRLAAVVARSHHERWDGTGYPDRLVGSNIPEVARIVAIAEAFDAMTHDRPWAEAVSVGDALAEIQRQAGRQFDPRLVRAFSDCVRRLYATTHDVDAYLEEQGDGSELARLQTRIDSLSSDAVS